MSDVSRSDDDMSIPTLSPELRAALALHAGGPVRLVDPDTKTEYVLVSAALFDRLANPVYDDNPWTDEEGLMLATAAGKAIGWDEMTEYDNGPDIP
jgi:hypothetical protein